MKKIVIVTLCLAVLIICGVSAHQKRNEADILFQNMASNLNGYPALPAPYCATIGYCCIDGNAYVLIMNENRTVYGMRTPEGETAYIFDGQSWIESPDGTLRPTDASVFREDVIGNRIAELMADRTVTYTYQKVSGATLPLIVYPGDSGYLQVRRSGYDRCMEVMVPGEGEDMPMRWSIIQEDGQILLYLYVTDSPFQALDAQILGWGAVPEKTAEYLR